MGCCTLGRVTPGLVLPEEEMILSALERNHPLAQLSIECSFSVFSRQGFSGSVQDSQFYRWCSELSLNNKATADLLDIIKHSGDQIDLKKLLTIIILLSQGSFQAKMQKLLTVYNPQSYLEFSDLLYSIIHVSLVSLPMLGRSEVPLMSISKYLTNISAAEQLLVNSIMEKLSEYDFRSVVKVFEEFKELQMICWGHGVRILLIEEDLRGRFSSSDSKLNRTEIDSYENTKKHSRIIQDDTHQQKTFCCFSDIFN